MTYKPVFFDLHELTCEHVFDKFGDTAWLFFDPRLLQTIDKIREAIDKPITVNNWYTGGGLSQRGLRCNLCTLVKNATIKDELYVSAHMEGQAADFDVKDMDADSVRHWLAGNTDKLPFPIRLETGVSWVHLDVRQVNERKINYFKS